MYNQVANNKVKEEEYTIKLRKILDLHFTEVAKKLNVVLSILPKETKEVELTIFLSQEGDGGFSIYVSLRGKELYVLNKPIRSSANIFQVKYTRNGFQPDVPMMGFEAEFDVNAVLSNIVGEWLLEVWNQAETKNITLPVTIVAVEGAIQILSLKIN
ncbi:DUF6389 family protein [Bernardetia sp.]|uniref:DUF6389 family protein n=1 Tax=Bernardetia sp. TaxID=1937974 RepID=UPI0025BAF97B|nr:DUF6389 family protein [Bernardetia sp.]